MPARLAVRVPRTFVDKSGQEQRRYTDVGTAFVPDEADRVDIGLHPGVVAAAAVVMMPRDDDGGTLPLPEHAVAERYNVTTSWPFENEAGETVTQYATLGVLFRNRAGTGFNLRLNDNVAIAGRVVAFPADRGGPGNDRDAPAGRFDDDLAGIHGDGAAERVDDEPTPAAPS